MSTSKVASLPGSSVQLWQRLTIAYRYQQPPTTLYLRVNFNITRTFSETKKQYLSSDPDIQRATQSPQCDTIEPRLCREKAQLDRY